MDGPAPKISVWMQRPEPRPSRGRAGRWIEPRVSCRRTAALFLLEERPEGGAPTVAQPLAELDRGACPSPADCRHSIGLNHLIRILLLHPSNTYIAVYDLPKIANLKKLYPELYREQPVLVDNNKD
jgi:hypothetical protein